MPTTVTMLQSRRGEDGNPWLVGQSYSASDAFAAMLITANYATGTLPIDRDLVPIMGQTNSAGQVTSLVSGDGNRLDLTGTAAANSMFSKYGVAAHGGAWLNTCGVGITIGQIGIASVALSNERPRFETYTRKATFNSAASELRFNSANFSADPVERSLSIDVYIESMPSEFLGASNPYIDISLHNTTTFGANYTRRSFNAGYLRQGWNTLKVRADDTVSATAGVGNLPTGQSRNADVGTGFDWTSAGQCLVLVFNNMNGQTVHVDQLRRSAKAKAVLTIGFDASGFNANDNVFPNKVAPLFAANNIRSYCTMTNVYELIYSGSAAWQRLAALYNTWQWDIINHTWSHGGTDVGRVVTMTSLTRASNVVTGTVSGGHSLSVGKVIKGSMQGATGTPGTDMNTNPANAMPDITVTSSTQFTYASTGSDGTATGTPRLYTYLSEVFSANNAENVRLLAHELTDVSRILKANGFSRAVSWAAFPNNSVPELSLLQAVATDAGIRFARAYRGGYTFVHELGVDNPLNMGSFVMDSGTNYTQLSTIQAKVAGAIARGEHIHIFGHYILDDEDSANAAYFPVDPDYPPGQGGNPAPPNAGLAGFGGWWYMSQLRKLVEQTIAPAVAAGTLAVKSPSEYTALMGNRDIL